MIKPFAFIGLAGLVSMSFSDVLMASTAALPSAAAISAARSAPYGGEGADDRPDPSLDDFWAPGAAGLFHLAHGRGRHGFAGGEGGEGGEGHPPYYVVPYPSYGHPGRGVARAPAALPALSVPCGSRSLIATLGGAAAGGFLGSKIGDGRGQLAAVAAGTVLGVFLGREVGGLLDATDAACANDAALRAHGAPIGQEIAWDNPRTGHSGALIPVREGTHRATGRYCREYQQTVVVGGRSAQAYGTACRQPDGSWEIIQ